MTDGDTGARDAAGPDRSALLLRGGLAVVLLAAVGATGGWLLAGEDDPSAPPTAAAEGLPATSTPAATRPTPGRSAPAAAPRTTAPSRSAGLTVPAVVGEDFTDAREELRDKRLGWRLVFGRGTGTTVERTSPAEGTEVQPGRTVTLYVSGPAPAATVPDVVGDDCDDAADELVDEGFYPQYRTGRTGKVSRQDPPGDGAGRWNDQVSIWCGDAPEDGGSPSPTP
ncbi:PASTA domain-containing protein [Micromonospora sp. DSM 115977]|uniref:PASTA domain-containing protein n=1 Tax=Micromonospora reichwaldensis TaxID=3075516 RepID=A0ABU2WP06_9ACTN|nr:PASTA domain-containing protein [Micromonospora sp. DSM 115977]MDT0527627.1 PASTA domain-containing protein [Micromonospora sp. DSM 115977]